MVTRATPDIDFSTFPTSDGEPMAETLANAIQMTDLQFALRHLLDAQGRTQAAIGGNQLMYYNEHNGWDHVSPDVYVALDVEPGGRAKWETWVEGKFPDVVFEITSPSTEEQDLSLQPPKGKRWLYAQLGVQEYYIYDPQQMMVPPLQGYVLREGRFEPLPLLPSGGIWSPLLGAELRSLEMSATEWQPGGTFLRVMDPATGQPIPVADEEHRALQAAQERLSAEMQARLALEERLAVVEQRANAAEQRANSEAEARHALEEQLTALQEQMTQMRATLRALFPDQPHGHNLEGTEDK